MNLIWQFHVDTKRGYDGSERRRMTVCSLNTITAYALNVGASYHMETNSKFFVAGHHGGPAMDRFQLIEERYDIYDYILYLDTDILLTPDYKDIFKAYAGCDVAGHNIIHTRDAELLASGWLRDAVDAERYKSSYFHGDIILMSRPFRQWLRNNVDPLEINIDQGKHWNTHGHEVRWPVYDQSLFAYWLSMSPFKLTPLSNEFTVGPNIVHEGGGKSPTTMKRFFDRYETINTQWQNYMSRLGSQ